MLQPQHALVAFCIGAHLVFLHMCVCAQEIVGALEIDEACHSLFDGSLSLKVSRCGQQ